MIKSAIVFSLSAFLVFLSAFQVSAVDEVLPSVKNTVVSTDHEPFIRQAFDLAISAGKKGNHPFGAVLVYQGKVVLTAENTVNTDNNCNHHAEANLLAKAHRELPREVIRQSTIYASATPCMFCCSAMWYSDIKKWCMVFPEEPFQY